ncbi:hypothetical protein ACR30L_09670 [Psychromonas sp. PT13]|uniref:hypothetical protein n=1 Tax=Psychromonas sp. PT13 TaxID=3439547 RepID=UPI003EB9A710
MNLTLKEFDLNLGLNADNDALLAVDLIPIDIPVFTSQRGKKVLAAFSDITSAHKLERIIALLRPVIEKQYNANTIDFTATPVFWLLPELAIEDNKHLIEWANALKNNFPWLFSHPKSQFFPYGRSAFSMAIPPLTALLDSAQINQVCIIAVDTLFHEIDDLLSQGICLDTKTGNGLIPSEGAIMACFQSEMHGLQVLFSQSERAIEQQQTQAIAQLFNQASRFLNKPYTDGKILQFYAPGNGEDKSLNTWLRAYNQLADNVDNQTQIKLLPQLTGELGCVTGLYHLLHIYHGYSNGIIKGNTLQLDVSNRLYQAVNVYSWLAKEKV